MLSGCCAHLIAPAVVGQELPAARAEGAELSAEGPDPPRVDCVGAFDVCSCEVLESDCRVVENSEAVPVLRTCQWGR